MYFRQKIKIKERNYLYLLIKERNYFPSPVWKICVVCVVCACGKNNVCAEK